MPLLTPSADVVIDSDAFNVAAANTTLIVRRDISLICRILGGDGIQVIAAGADLIIHGEVSGENGVNGSNSYKVQIGGTGMVSGVTGLNAGNFDIRGANAGTIIGATTGIIADELTLSNSGLISGPTAINVSEDMNLINTGTILGTVQGGTDDDEIFNLGFIEEARLGEGNDTYHGSDQKDVVSDGAGEDTIDLGGGRDEIRLSPDADVDHLDGGEGIDLLDMGALQSAVSVNVARGVALNGGGGANQIENFESYNLTANSDVFFGDALRETVRGGNGNDLISARDGSDRLFGGAGSDTINGEAGNDRLVGGDDSDSLNGGDGTDQIIGGKGADTMAGGTGADVFTFRPADFLPTNVPTLSERITDFSVAEDRIDLSSFDGPGSGDSALVFRGTAGINGAGQVAIRSLNGNTVVDISFTLATVEATMLLDGALALTAANFFL